MVFPVDSLRATFAASMLFRDASEENFARKMPAEAWFGFRGCDRFEVGEQSFRLPGDEVLTVLKLPDDGRGLRTGHARHRPVNQLGAMLSEVPDANFASQILPKNAKVGRPRCSTGVLHRQKRGGSRKA